MRLQLAFVLCTLCVLPVMADDSEELAKVLAEPILPPGLTVTELRALVEPRIPVLPEVRSPDEWSRHAERLRQEILDKIVFRGVAARWKTAPARVEYVDSLPGQGYSIRKLRFEIIPGFWAPALLYVPDKMNGKVPVMLAVNGHEAVGKAAPYKQARCINLAKRGMLVLNVEWLGMGQLRVPGNRHGAMDQLNLCGTSGLSLFFLNMTRGLDLLLEQPHADPARVAVSGLSGGGWQTIVVSALDPRVDLANPVAGYSSFRTRLDKLKDLGDSEQTPNDLATLADYTHLTALRAPKPTLLTYNAKDNCCFESGYALPPLVSAAEPLYQLFGRTGHLRTHVNHDPGDHNFGLENREALYRMIGDHYYPADAAYSAKEIPCEAEIRTAQELEVALPADHLTINGVALKLAAELPRGGPVPAKDARTDAWADAQRRVLAELVRLPRENEYMVTSGEPASRPERTSTRHTVRVGGFSVPVLELCPNEPRGTVVSVSDTGRAGAAAVVSEQLAAGQRVLLADIYNLGEMHPPSHDYLWCLMLATVGERPLGIQAQQIDAVCRWAVKSFQGGEPVRVVAVGPRSSTATLVAGALAPQTLAGVELHDPLGSLKEIIETNRTVETTSELFCFGLLERFDTSHLAALIAPRPVVVKNPSERVKAEWAGLATW